MLPSNGLKRGIRYCEYAAVGMGTSATGASMPECLRVSLPASAFSAFQQSLTHAHIRQMSGAIEGVRYDSIFSRTCNDSSIHCDHVCASADRTRGSIGKHASEDEFQGKSDHSGVLAILEH
jgi:hypothetical protein